MTRYWVGFGFGQSGKDLKGLEIRMASVSLPSLFLSSLPCILDVGMMLVPTKCVGGRKNYQAHEEEEPRYAQIPHKDVCSRSRSIYRCCCIIYGLRSVWVCRVSTSKFPLGGAGLINQADIAAAGKRTTSLSDG